MDELPKCRLCGGAPHHYRSGYAECDTQGCAMRGVVMTDDDWRRLHGRSLAQEKETMNSKTTHDAGACTSEPPCSTEPCRRAFSREEMIEEAKAYMRETWGPCRESADRDRWHERLGMLVDFIHNRFPSNAEAVRPAVAGTHQPLVGHSGVSE